MMEKKCLACNKKFTGRVDKLYCSDYCKSDYHYQKNKGKTPTFYRRIDNQLRLNHRLLKHFNKSGKSTIRAQKLIDAGFNPRIFTHYWKTKGGNVYLFCYEYGFWKTTENGKDKYVLVEWQPNYMKLDGI